jgi:hypothetical protein
MISLYNLLFENNEDKDLEKDLVSSAINDLETQLNSLEEKEKLVGFDKEEERMRRLIQSMKDEGRTDELYAMAYVLRSKGVEKLLSKKFVDYAYNSPEGLAKYGANLLKRDIKSGAKVDGFNDDKVRFSGQKKNPLDTPKGVFVKAVFDFILKSNVDETAKFALIDIIKDPRNLIPGSAFEGDSISGNLIDLLPKKIQNNKAFKEVANNVLRFKQGRAVGAGEGFLTVFGKNAGPSKAKNDINIDGVDMEVKASPGGQQFSIDDGGGAKNKGMDQMNKRYFPFLKNGADFRINAPEFIEYIKEKGKPHLKKYFAELYPVIDDSDISKITNITWNNLGKDKKEMSNLVKDIIFKSYKQQHKFDSFIVINPNNGDFVATSSDKLPSNLIGVDWALIKGQDTQATPAGFIRLSMR